MRAIFVSVRKGNRRRGIGGKTPVFGLVKRNGKVHAFSFRIPELNRFYQLLDNQLNQIPLLIEISFSGYDVLDVFEFHHERINHLKPLGKNLRR